MLVAFLKVIILIFLLIFQQKSYELNEVEQIQYVNNQAEKQFKGHYLKGCASWCCESRPSIWKC